MREAPKVDTDKGRAGRGKEGSAGRESPNVNTVKRKEGRRTEA